MTDKKQGKKQKEEVDFSTMTPEEIKEYKREKRKVWWQALKYALCTASAGIIEAISFAILSTICEGKLDGYVYFGQVGITLDSFVPTFIALMLSIIWNFTLNRKVTFKSAGNVPRAMFLAFLFYVPFFPFKLWFNGSMIIWLGDALGKEGARYLGEITSMLLNGILEFCWQKFVIYRNEEDTAVEVDYTKIGPNGEIYVKPQKYTGPQISAMMSAGLDINAMKDKDMDKWLKKNF